MAQANALTNVDFSLVRFCGIHLRAISQVPKLLFCVMSLKMILVILLLDLLEASELMFELISACVFPELTHDMSEGQMVTGVCSQSSRPDFLIVNLSGGYRGSVALTDLSDKYRHLPLEKFSRNELVRCCILDSTEKTRCALSLRRSRWVDIKCHIQCDTIL